MNTRKLMAKADALKKNKKNKKGFTLVELIVVLVILAILMAILIPTMSGYISRANKTSDQSATKTCYTAYAAAITDAIGVNTKVSDTDLSNKGTAVKTALTEYLSSDEISKIASCTVVDQSIRTLVYKGSKYWVQLSATADGTVSYKFVKITDSNKNAAPSFPS